MSDAYTDYNHSLHVEELNSEIEALTAQVSAITEQRDAAVAACKAAHKWMFDEATIHPDAPTMQPIIDQLAAALAMTEGAK